MLYHPDTRPDEQFVGNHVTWQTFLAEIAALPTLRLGAIAYDLDGKKISPNYMRPVFIGKSDYDRYDKAMQAELSRIHNRQKPGPRAHSAQQLEILSAITKRS
jgi:hypothetical protein